MLKEEYEEFIKEIGLLILELSSEHTHPDKTVRIFKVSMDISKHVVSYSSLKNLGFLLQ